MFFICDLKPLYLFNVVCLAALIPLYNHNNLNKILKIDCLSPATILADFSTDRTVLLS